MSSFPRKPKGNGNSNTDGNIHAYSANDIMNNNEYPTMPTNHLSYASGYSTATKNMTGADAVDMDRYNTFGNEEGNNQSSGQNVKAKDTQITFPQRLLQVLAERDSADAISWLSHGKSFIVYDKKKFVESILPRFFKESKFTSFTRKLNRWGFTRISRGVETGAYQHEYFRRDEPNLCLKMRCQKKHETKKIDATPTKRKSHGAKDKNRKKEREESYSESPPPLSSPPIPAPTISAAITNNKNGEHDDIPPLKNNNPKSNYDQLMELQQQQREIEQRLQEAVQNASQQPKGQQLFPHILSRAQINMFSAQSPQLLQQQMGNASEMSGMIPMQTQSIPVLPNHSMPILQNQFMPGMQYPSMSSLPPQAMMLQDQSMLAMHNQPMPQLQNQSITPGSIERSNAISTLPNLPDPYRSNSDMQPALPVETASASQEPEQVISKPQTDKASIVESYMGIDSYLSANPKYNRNNGENYIASNKDHGLSGDDKTESDSDDE